MLRVHKIRLNPNQAQANYLARACGTARFAYNWALAEWQTQYEACKLDPSLPKPNEGALRKQLNAIKREQFPWMLEVTKCAPQEAIRALGTAYKNWFASLSGKRKGPKMKAPRFKRKGVHDSFKIDEKFAIEGSRIRIPNLGWVRMREPLRFKGALKGATFSRTAHAWFVAILVDTDDLPARTESQSAVGVDLGVKHLATLSTGEVFEGPKALGRLLAKLRRLSRAHSRKVKGSANRRKSAQHLARLHWRISCVRNDAIHKLTDQLTRQYGWVAIEDLNVKGMMANRRLARHVGDAAFGEVRRQLTYKAQQCGVVLAAVDRFFPSSKLCSNCGEKHEALTLSDRFWACTHCGTTHDRDVNAAKNILRESVRMFESSTPGVGELVATQATAALCVAVEGRKAGELGAQRKACGAMSADDRSNPAVKLAATKQEVNA